MTPEVAIRRENNKNLSTHDIVIEMMKKPHILYNCMTLKRLRDRDKICAHSKEHCMHFQ